MSKTSTYLVIINTPFPTINVDQRIPHDILDKGPRMQLPQHEPQRIRPRIREQHKLVPRKRLVKVQPIIPRLIRRKRLIPAISITHHARPTTNSLPRQLPNHITQAQHNTIHQLGLLVKRQCISRSFRRDRLHTRSTRSTPRREDTLPCAWRRGRWKSVNTWSVVWRGADWPRPMPVLVVDAIAVSGVSWKQRALTCRRCRVSRLSFG